METFNLAQLTKEMVVGQIKKLKDPTLLAAEVVRHTLVTRLRGHKLSNYEIQEAVIEVCRGAMMGMLLMDCPLPRGAAAILGNAHVAAREAGLDKNLVAVAAVKGIADIRRFVTPGNLADIRGRLEASREGSGAYFDRFCADLDASLSHPGYKPPRA